MSKTVMAFTCLFCEDSYSSSKKFQPIEQSGGGNTIRYDLTSFLGHESEYRLRDDDMLCCRCMYFFEHLAHTRRMLIDFLIYRDDSIDVKVQKFNNILDEFIRFASNLANYSPCDSDLQWDNRLRCQTPNPFVYSHFERYDPNYEKKIELEEKRKCGAKSSLSLYSETDKEVFKYTRKHRRRGKRWTNPRGEAQSRARSEAYPSFVEITSKRRCHSRPKKAIPVRERIRTRSVSRADRQQMEEMVTRELKNYFCDKCHLQFNDIDNLVLHKICAHDAVPRFKCTHCPESVYTTKEELAIHNRIHDTETLHCFHCRQEIIGTENLQEHLRLHQQKSLGCEFCWLSFISKEDREKHCKLEHKGKKTKVHERTSTVLKRVVNSEKLKTTNENNVDNTNNNNTDNRNKFKEKNYVAKIYLNVRRTPSPDPVIPFKKISRSSTPRVKLIKYNSSGRQSTVPMRDTPPISVEDSPPISVSDSSFNLPPIVYTPISIQDSPLLLGNESTPTTVSSEISPGDVNQKSTDLLFDIDFIENECEVIIGETGVEMSAGQMEVGAETTVGMSGQITLLDDVTIVHEQADEVPDLTFIDNLEVTPMDYVPNVIPDEVPTDDDVTKLPQEQLEEHSKLLSNNEKDSFDIGSNCNNVTEVIFTDDTINSSKAKISSESKTKSDTVNISNSEINFNSNLVPIDEPKIPHEEHEKNIEAPWLNIAITSSGNTGINGGIELKSTDNMSQLMVHPKVDKNKRQLSKNKPKKVKELDKNKRQLSKNKLKKTEESDKNKQQLSKAKVKKEKSAIEKTKRKYKTRNNDTVYSFNTKTIPNKRSIDGINENLQLCYLKPVVPLKRFDE